MQDLRPEDRLAIKEKIQTIALGEDLSILKQQAIAEYKDVDSLSEDKINALPPVTGISKRVYESYDFLLSTEQRIQSDRERRIHSRKIRIESSYINKVSEMIYTLKNLNWIK